MQKDTHRRNLMKSTVHNNKLWKETKFPLRIDQINYDQHNDGRCIHIDEDTKDVLNKIFIKAEFYYINEILYPTHVHKSYTHRVFVYIQYLCIYRSLVVK